MAGALGDPSKADTIQNHTRELRADLATTSMRWSPARIKWPTSPVTCGLTRGFASVRRGYRVFVVPQRAVVIRPDAEALVELAKKHQLVVKTSDALRPKDASGWWASY